MTEPSWMKGPPRRILLATDLSCRCDRALDRAVALGRQWQAQLLVLHVLDPRETFAEQRRLEDLPTWRQSPDRVRLIERQMRRDILEEFDDVIVRIEEGDPATVIEEMARRENCGLIVTGVARDQTFGRLFLGATVDRLVRRSPIPVLIVKNRTRFSYGKVVVATDFSDSSRHALDAAIKFFPDTDLSLFHAFEVPFAALLDKDPYRDSLRKMERQACDEFLQKAAATDAMKAKVRVFIEHGPLDLLLRAFVQDKDVDLVVLGTHGHSGLYEMLIGSTAKQILEFVPADVLVTREPRATVPA